MRQIVEVCQEAIDLLEDRQLLCWSTECVARNLLTVGLEAYALLMLLVEVNNK